MAYFGATETGQKESRIERLRTKSSDESEEDSDNESPPSQPDIHFPDIPSAFGYLVGLFHLSGQVLQESQGLAPLTWCEIKAFREENELDLCIWEKRILKKMSEAYVGEYSRASDPSRKAPYTKVVEEEKVDKVAVALNIMKGLSAFKKAKG